MREWEFAGNLVVRNLHFCCGEHGFSPWLGSLRPASHAVWPKIEKKKKKEEEEDEGDESSEFRESSANDLLCRAVCGPASGTLFFLPL